MKQNKIYGILLTFTYSESPALISFEVTVVWAGETGAGAGIRSGTYGLDGDDPEDNEDDDDEGDSDDVTDSRTSEAPKRILIRRPPGVFDGT